MGEVALPAVSDAPMRFENLASLSQIPETYNYSVVLVTIAVRNFTYNDVRCEMPSVPHSVIDLSDVVP